MYSRLLIQTRLSPAEAERVLHTLVKPKISFREPDRTPDPRPFVGRVEDGQFKFHRVVTGKNSFLPIISGRIVKAEDGALVTGTMRLAAAVAVVVPLWIGAFTYALVHEVHRSLQTGPTWRLANVAFLLLFGTVLTVTGYYPEKRKAERLLASAFEQRDR